MGSTTRTTIRLEVPSRLEMLDKAGELVDQVTDFGGFDEDSRLDIRVAVHESLVNAIRHGNRGVETLRVVLEIDLHPGGLEVRVQDQGQGFDPGSVPDPLALENLCRSSGRGILLMRALMDAVAFRFHPDGGTEVTMRRRIGRRIESACDLAQAQAA